MYASYWHCDGRSVCIKIQMRPAPAMLAHAADRMSGSPPHARLAASGVSAETPDAVLRILSWQVERRVARRRQGSLSLIRRASIGRFHQPDACASRSIDAISITATIAFTGVYCSGPARCAVAWRTNRTGAGSAGP